MHFIKGLNSEKCIHNNMLYYALNTHRIHLYNWIVPYRNNFNSFRKAPHVPVNLYLLLCLPIVETFIEYMKVVEISSEFIQWNFATGFMALWIALSLVILKYPILLLICLYQMCILKMIFEYVWIFKECLQIFLKLIHYGV